MFDINIFQNSKINFSPPLFLAPMAGITHSAFRRLLADFGGYRALYSEMLSVKALARENVFESPFTKRRSCEGNVIYQLWLNGTEDLKIPIDKLKNEVKAEFLDINLGCPAPEIKNQGAGISLFLNKERLIRILDEIRNYWDGFLSIKCRLGQETENWPSTLVERLRIFEQYKISMLTIHPRFSHEKLKRVARHNELAWICKETQIPIIANGDLYSHDDIKRVMELGCSGAMLGRFPVVEPWIFAKLSNLNPHFEYREVWERFFKYTLEDFTSQKAIGRIKEFSAYFARNFFFGHSFYTSIQNSENLETLYQRAQDFFNSNPKLVSRPTVDGI